MLSLTGHMLSMVQERHGHTMRFLCKLLLPFLALASLSWAKSSSGDSVLVILDPTLKKDNFSIFFGDLESQ